MAIPNNIRLTTLNDNGSGPYGSGTIRPARGAVEQFLLNVFGGWQHNKPQLFKDVPATDVVTPQVAYLTGQGSAEESMAGFGGPARINGGLQYGRYSKNAINYGAKQGVQASARQGQQFIKSQAQNIVRNPTKPGTGIPFRGAEAQAPIVEGYSIKAVPESMAGMQPGSVKPVIPWTTKARVAGIDAKNAIKQGVSKAASSTKAAASKHVGVPLRNAAKDFKPQNNLEKGLLGGLGVSAAGLAGMVGYGIATGKFSPNNEPSETRKAADRMYKKSNPSKTNGPTKVSDTKVITPGGTKSGNIKPPAKTPPVTPKVDQKAKATSPAVPKSVQPAASTKTSTPTKTKTGTAAPTSATKTTPPVITPKVELPANAQTIQAAKVIPSTKTPNTEIQNDAWNTDLQSAEQLAINTERNRLAGTPNVALKPIAGTIATQPTGLATAHPRVLSPQVSTTQQIADNIFSKGRVMGYKFGGVLKIKNNG